MDLADLDTKASAETGAPMTLQHPKTGEPLRQPVPDDAPPGTEGNPITITMAGQDSDRYRRARNAQVTKRLARRTPGKITGEDAEGENLDVLVACCMGWDGIVDQGVALPCIPANVRKIFMNYPWIREQAESFTHDRANFLGD